MATPHSYSMHFSKQVALLCGIKGKTLLLSGRSVGWSKRVLLQIGINTPWQWKRYGQNDVLEMCSPNILYFPAVDDVIKPPPGSLLLSVLCHQGHDTFFRTSFDRTSLIV